MTDPGRTQAPSGGWRTAVVTSVVHPGPRTVRVRLRVADRVDHLPGQHYVLRLTAEDGYTAARSYSVASPPSDPEVELLVERLDDGEVSTFLAEVVQVGDVLEVRGPIGGWFVWDGRTPALGIGGGTGVVPLVAMLRHARAIGRPELLRLAVSARTLADLPYSDELIEAGAVVALSRSTSSRSTSSGSTSSRPTSGNSVSGADRLAGRLTAADLQPLIGDPSIESAGTAFVCGSAAFAEALSLLLVELGMPAGLIRVERFGPSAA